LRETVNYELVYSFIKNAVTSRKHYLLESLASGIARGLLKEFSVIDLVKVTVRKPHPPVKGVVDYVEVEIVEPRS
jgi:dihydroneopterin aldolase